MTMNHPRSRSAPFGGDGEAGAATVALASPLSEDAEDNIGEAVAKAVQHPARKIFAGLGAWWNHTCFHCCCPCAVIDWGLQPHASAPSDGVSSPSLSMCFVPTARIRGSAPLCWRSDSCCCSGQFERVTCMYTLDCLRSCCVPRQPCCAGVSSAALIVKDIVAHAAVDCGCMDSSTTSALVTQTCGVQGVLSAEPRQRSPSPSSSNPFSSYV